MFGVEYGRECYCGNSLNPGSIPALAGDCNTACLGSSAENCGAGNRLNVYLKAATSSPSSSSKTTTTPTATPTPLAYFPRGCYTEATIGRALVGTSSGNNSMTVELCAAACSGYPLFGVEYYRECYCGYTLMVGSVPAPNTDCNHNCAGNPAETCGGDNRLNLYQYGTSTSSGTATLTAAYTSSGCYTEATLGRALSSVTYYDDSMTVEKCTSVCSGCTWFGVEYGRECYCGNTINAGSIPAVASECNSPCLGNSAEICGGSNRLNIYHSNISLTSSSTSSSSLTSSSTSSISSSSSTSSSKTTSSTSSSTISSSSTSSSSTSSLTSSSSTSSSSSISSSTSSSSTSSTSSTSSLSTSSSPTSSSSASSSSTSSSSTSSSITTSSSSSSAPTSSSTSIASSSTTTSTGPTCATPLLDPDFETTSAVPWVIHSQLPFLTYNFQDPGTSSLLPYSGSLQASISYKQYVPNLESWFNQPITVCPNTVYNLSAWSKLSTSQSQLNTCTIYFYIASSDSSTVVQIMSTYSGLGSRWTQQTGTFTSGTTTNLTFNIRIICSSGNNPAKTFYFDDITFTAAS